MAQRELLNEYIDVYLTAFKYVGDLVSAPTKQYNLSFEQFLIMRDIDAGHQLQLSEIAKRRGVTRAAISRQIKTLLELQYIHQERDANDRRRLYLRLTEKGSEVTHELNDAIQKRFDSWVDIMGEADVRELLRIMQRVGTKIIAQDKDK